MTSAADTTTRELTSRFEPAFTSPHNTSLTRPSEPIHRHGEYIAISSSVRALERPVWLLPNLDRSHCVVFVNAPGINSLMRPLPRMGGSDDGPDVEEGCCKFMAKYGLPGALASVRCHTQLLAILDVPATPDHGSDRASWSPPRSRTSRHVLQT